MPHHPDVLVLGGGVVGLTTAYFLAREGISVTVLDKGEIGREASWAGAGILPPGNPERARTPVDQLRARSAVLFPTLSAELRERTGLDNGYLRCGGIEVPAPEAPPDEEWRGEGIAVRAAAAGELRQLEPGLAPEVTRAFFLPDMAQVRNPRHLQALRAACQSCGVWLRPGCPAQGFERNGNRVTALRTASGELSAGRYVIAAGAWTEGLIGELGFRPGIRPVRGQITLLNTGAPLISKVIVEGKRYLVPRPDGRVLAGSTEEDVGFDKRTTAGAVAGLLAFAIRLVPGLVEAPVERCWAGLRPGSPDGLPYLGPVPGLDNVFVAAGHFRAGIQLSPATGLVMKELLLGRAPTVPLDAFRLDRAPAPPARPAFRS